MPQGRYARPPGGTWPASQEKVKTCGPFRRQSASCYEMAMLIRAVACLFSCAFPHDSPSTDEFHRPDEGKPAVTSSLARPVRPVGSPQPVLGLAIGAQTARVDSLKPKLVGLAPQSKCFFAAPQCAPLMPANHAQRAEPAQCLKDRVAVHALQDPPAAKVT